MTEKNIHREEHHTIKWADYLGDFVYGANDGIITTFAVIAGAAGAGFSSGVVIILGMANLVADGISMGLSNFLSLRSRRAYEGRQRAREVHEVENFPEVEREEVRVILKRWGVPESRVEEVLDGITRDKKKWVDLMMIEELGIIETSDNDPVRHGLATFTAFSIAGALPLIPYVFGVAPDVQFSVAIWSTAAALFFVGASRSWVTHSPFIRSGLEMLLVGGVASGAAYAVGAYIQIVFGA